MNFPILNCLILFTVLSSETTNVKLEREDQNHLVVLNEKNFEKLTQSSTGATTGINYKLFIYLLIIYIFKKIFYFMENYKVNNTVKQ
ncbi:uncharacterized protein TA14085 [Theileria annulata]|uniref:Uncharacterized protein n=1 Tax=Theileria annulata TaxID=5874 RepID=Q4UEV6_THEAN|nr:uncharacterized protein TA14085 [Theileria annulata]CAI74383.1 hypothetical protein TA14085 [Theileria annulata]|eukprot:XP_952115.1 hypothetical protein TA14085 [Theileria annulata]